VIFSVRLHPKYSMPTINTSSISILLIDDHVVMRTALRLLIEGQPGLVVVGEASTRARALMLAARDQPAIILLDLDLGDERGVDLIPELLSVAKDTRVIALTGLRDAEEHRQALRKGALGLVLKEQALGVLVQAVKQVHAGAAWFDSALVASVLAARTRGQEIDAAAAGIATLTEREREIIPLICEGLKNKQIGQRLGISMPTVGHHLTSIFAKLGLNSRLELLTYAYQHGLAKPY
jgi:two-component system, NarL family, response regulator NreC